MKKLFLIALACFPLMTLAQERYTININIGAVEPDSKVFLFKQIKGQLYVDTAAQLSKDRFVFRGEQKAPLKAFILMRHGSKMLFDFNSSDKVGVYLENGIVNVNTKDSLIRATVGGTRLNNEQQDMMNMMAKAGKDTTAQESAAQSFINAHPHSLVALNLIRSRVDPGTNVVKAQKLFNKIDPKIQQTDAGHDYLRLINAVKALELDKMAPEFTLQNPKGDSVSLRSFHGKYVLVDFWASWCGPCRRENPNILAAYQKFKDKNFKVLGVSFDKGNAGKKQWLQAIQTDGMPWEQVSDLKGWQSPVAALYMIRSIPANVLIDPTGKIIAKNLRGDALEKKLAEIL